LCYDRASAKNGREHNDSNVLTLGARLLTDSGGRRFTYLAGDSLRRRTAPGACPEDHGHRAAVFQEGILVTHTDLDRLVAQIGEELLARVGPQRLPAKAGEGLNLPDQVCPGCVQRCVQTCAKNTKEIIAAGASRVSASERLTKIDPAIAALIDHTILKPDATRADVVKVCKEARQYNFASVCINPFWVPLVKSELAGSP